MADPECCIVRSTSLFSVPAIADVRPTDYLLPISLLATDTSIPVIMYDQLGCGLSTHLPERKGDEAFWTPALFMAELTNLLHALSVNTFHLLGQSWGGMLAAQYVIEVRPPGLQKLMICNSPATLKSWTSVCTALRSALPADVREVLDRHEKDGTTDSPEYEQATYAFYRRHVCRVQPFPPELEASLKGIAEDNTVYGTMNGPSEFTVVGNLKDWDCTADLDKIDEKAVPGGVLLINGTWDEAQDETLWPFFNGIKARVKWVRFPLSSHTPMLEETEDFLKALRQFLETR
jgi:L-proline amide hydrolase